MLKSKSTFIPKQLSGERFDIAASHCFPELSRKKIKAIIDNGGAYLNKKRILIAKYSVKENDKLEIFWEENTPEVKQERGLTVNKSLGAKITAKTLIFDHADFFIFEKPAGIPCQATLSSSKETFLHALEQFDPKKYQVTKMFLVHRLDKETSGLMIVAKNQKAQKIFEDLFRQHKIEKQYLAVCAHMPKDDSGIINFPIVKDKNRTNCYVAILNNKIKTEGMKSAETHFDVQKKSKQKDASLILCTPKTGRTHQIRVHLSAIGCPIMGDKTYAQNIYGHPFARSALRQMLHACTLKFSYGSEELSFTSPLPEDFVRVMNNIG